MPPPRSRRASPASVALRHHLDRVDGALLEARRAAGAAVVVEPVAMPDAELDHRVLRTGAEAAVTLEAVPAGQAPPGLINRRLDRQAADHLGKSRDPLVRRELRLGSALPGAEVPPGQGAEPLRLRFLR